MDAKIIRPTSDEPAIASYLNRKGCALGLPINGTFELTARCNFDCKMCYVHLKKDIEELRKKELTTDQWLSIASEARDMGMIFLLLTGGEPFLREDFATIYTELIKMGMIISINTNASLYNEEIRDLFRKYRPTRINATLYGGSEETYEKLCGNASYERVVKNLVSMKEDNLPVRLNVSLTPYNIQDMERIHALSREMQLWAKGTSYMYPPVRVTGEVGCNHARFEAEEAGRILARWNRLQDNDEMFRVRAERIRNHQMARELDSCVDVEQEGVMCRAGRSSFWATWDGRLLPCGTMDIEPSNLLTDGFAKAWQDVRERTAKILLPKECANCAYRPNCGVCAASCKCETGEFGKAPEYMCRMTKTMCGEVLRMAEQLDLNKEN